MEETAIEATRNPENGENLEIPNVSENLTIPENPENLEFSDPTVTAILPPPVIITCPYNEEHQVPIYEFNRHVWKCRSETLVFYPHMLSLKRCRHNMQHFLPEDELPFHEIFCRQYSEELEKTLKTEPIVLNVADFLATQKARKAFDDAESSSSDDDSDDNEVYDENGERKKKKKTLSVTSEIPDSEIDEEDMMETFTRLEYLDIEDEILNIND